MLNPRLLVSLCLFPLLSDAVSSAAEAADSAAPQSKLELKDGDRVAFVGATFVERDRHFGEFESVLRSRFPGKKLSFRNMAWPGDTTTVQLRPLNFGSLEKHLTAMKPTVVFVSYGANEAYDGEAGLSSFLAGYSSILDLLAKTGARIVVVSPIRQEKLGPPLPDPAAVNQNLELYSNAVKKLAADRGLMFVDLLHTVIDSSTTPPAYPLTENGVHLTDYGYWRAAQTLADHLTARDVPWKVELTAKGTSDEAKASGTRMSKVHADEQHVTFEATDLRGIVPAPEGAPLDVSAEQMKRLIVVHGLKPGRYTLSIDGNESATATAKEWNTGVLLRGGPEWERGTKLREEIVWKNLMFFNRWRAHNGEYIYGRRSTTSEGYDRNKDGGNAGNPSFPGEMAEFDRLLEASDRKTDDLALPRAHTYELSPTK